MDNFDNIKNSLTIEQVKDLLFALGGDPIIKGDIILARTICHGGQSHKLYYYDNTKLFKCYTDCPEGSFDVYDLIIKYNKNENKEMNLYQAVNFVVNFFNLVISNENFIINNEELTDWKILNKYEENNSQEKQQKIVDLKFYDKKILKYLPQPKLPMWLKEGITQEVMNKVDIKFDPVH